MTMPSSVMYTTIRRTPADLERICSAREAWLPRAAAMVRDAGRVFCIGTGTSYHAALHAGWQLRWAGCDARAWSSQDFVTYPPALRPSDVAIVFAHTGTTGFSGRALAAVKASGVPSIAVTGIDAPASGAALSVPTTPLEQSAAYTASHSGAVFVMALLAGAVARDRGLDAPADEDYKRLPGQVEALIAREAEVEPVAADLLHRRTFCAGAGPDAPLALEVALKTRETAYTSIDALPTEQFIHGPVVTVNRGDGAILFATESAGKPRTRELLGILADIGLQSWVVGNLAEVPAGVQAFALPEAHPLIAPNQALIPLQLFACYTAAIKGTNADSFRADVPEYKRAWDELAF